MHRIAPYHLRFAVTCWEPLMSYHCSLRSWCSLIRCQVALLRQFPGFHYYIIYKLRQFFLFRSLRYSTVGYTSLRLMWPTVLALLHNILSFISLCLFVSQQCWKRASSRPHRCIVVFEQETWYTRQRYCRFIMWPMDSQWAVMVEEHQCWCCPRGKSLSSRILQDQFTSPYPCPWTTKSSKIIKDFAFCKQSVTYDPVVYKFGYRHCAWEWLTYWYRILLRPTDIHQ